MRACGYARYKLIRFYESDEWELFDTESDPGEVNSIYGKEGHEKITAELKADLKRLRAEYRVTEPAL